MIPMLNDLYIVEHFLSLEKGAIFMWISSSLGNNTQDSMARRFSR